MPNNTLINTKTAIVFFVGGANDKYSFLKQSPTYLTLSLYDKFVQRLNQHTDKLAIKERLIYGQEIAYLGYNEIYSDDNIQKNILAHISNKQTAIYLIGHSLGAWNVAHLSGYLSKLGYCVRLLITLDPVGCNKILQYCSSLYKHKPKPIAQAWINISCTPKQYDYSDNIALIGGRFNIRKLNYQPNHCLYYPIHHGDVLPMANLPIINGKNVLDLLFDDVKNLLIG